MNSIKCLGQAPAQSSSSCAALKTPQEHTKPKQNGEKGDKENDDKNDNKNENEDVLRIPIFQPLFVQPKCYYKSYLHKKKDSGKKDAATSSSNKTGNVDIFIVFVFFLKISGVIK